ncbi:hypothetical protein BS50DRAFT_570891 [Corynespora cassiicola Philippines]|uniref:Rhodopsin domain-containing protein n=1 Tax=Corynespora cassiicola Philippines TaxID=1448308 RepID=A0A2T2P1K8_CORCC|nr:hypothetical protein BS50DRAFT_570891 [Corynespora cassiicola Philippines]
MRQQSRATTAGYTAPRIEPPVFLGVIWTLTVLSLLFLPARLYARWKSFRRFFWDDFFVVFAGVISLAITAACTALNSVTYEVMDIGSGKKKFPPNVKIITMQFTRLFVVVPMLLYTGLWCVKLAFLLFFRRLGVRSVTSLCRLWWVVFVVTVVCYFVCYATLPYRCSLISFQVVISEECMTQGLSFTSMKVNCALDVLTDCLIMTIPFMILRRVRISIRQRIALSLVFSLVVVTMIFAIVRATITTINVNAQMDPIWMYMWTNIELNVAIVVACVAPYRTLFIRERTPSFQPTHQRRSFKEAVAKVKQAFSSSGRGTEGDDTWSTAELPHLEPWAENEEEEQGGPIPAYRGEIPQAHIR